MILQKWAANYFPYMGKYKRYFIAAINSWQTVKRTYSQHGEDEFILETLKNHNLHGSLYIDVGANHPSDISNTYLLYRHGLSGVVIEPNLELVKLFHRFFCSRVAWTPWPWAL